MPGIRLIHPSIKAVVQTVFIRRNVAQMVIKIEVSENVYLSALRTGNWTADGREVVFIPGAPDVTSGIVVEIHPAAIIETDETFIEVLVRLVSCGFGDARDQQDPSILLQTPTE